VGRALSADWIRPSRDSSIALALGWIDLLPLQLAGLSPTAGSCGASKTLQPPQPARDLARTLKRQVHHPQSFHRRTEPECGLSCSSTHTIARTLVEHAAWQSHHHQMPIWDDGSGHRCRREQGYDESVVYRFSAYELRTTDVERARAFNKALFSPSFFSAGIRIAALPAAAIARGAVPHWLGHIGVDDVSATTDRFIAQGATRLGPATDAASTLRDPSGAVLAISPSTPLQDVAPVVWRVLHAQDERAAFAVYANLFGWTRPSDEDGQAMIGHEPFTWNVASAPAGIVTNSAQLAGVHAHWLFFFATDDLDRTIAAVQASGGRSLPVVTAYGQRLAPCEDPQGAAFGLSQRSVG